MAVAFYAAHFGAGIGFLLAAISLCLLCWPLWLPLAAYLTWSLLLSGERSGLHAARTGSYPTPLRRLPVWRAAAAYFPARLHKTADLPASQQYIFCIHPHGILSYSAWLAFGTEALGLGRLFPGLDCRLLTLSINFRSPGFREWLLLHGMCDVSKRSCLTLLGAGKSVAVVVGGGAESLYSRPGTHELVLRRRRGFVALALRAGAPLVPVLCFGEANTYRTANSLPPGSRVRAVQRRMNAATGFTLPLFAGAGLLLPWGLLPFPVPLDVVVGAPLEVARFEGDEDSAEFRALADRTHARYVAALRALFEQHCERFAPGEGELVLVE